MSHSISSNVRDFCTVATKFFQQFTKDSTADQLTADFVDYWHGHKSCHNHNNNTLNTLKVLPSDEALAVIHEVFNSKELSALEDKDWFSLDISKMCELVAQTVSQDIRLHALKIMLDSKAMCAAATSHNSFRAFIYMASLDTLYAFTPPEQRDQFCKIALQSASGQLSQATNPKFQTHCLLGRLTKNIGMPQPT
jgi:hypothetical protein